MLQFEISESLTIKGAEALPWWATKPTPLPLQSIFIISIVPAEESKSIPGEPLISAEFIAILRLSSPLMLPSRIRFSIVNPSLLEIIISPEECILVMLPVANAKSAPPSKLTFVISKLLPLTQRSLSPQLMVETSNNDNTASPCAEIHSAPESDKSLFEIVILPAELGVVRINGSEPDERAIIESVNVISPSPSIVISGVPSTK